MLLTSLSRNKYPNSGYVEYRAELQCGKIITGKSFAELHQNIRAYKESGQGVS